MSPESGIGGKDPGGQGTMHREGPEGAPGTIVERRGFLVRRLHQIWSGALQRAFREAGFDITSVQFAALDTVVQCERLDQTDLALRIGYDRATTGGLIARLEQGGYLKREPDPRDRRARRLIATEKGRHAAATLGRIAEKSDAALLAPLAPPEQEALFAALHALVTAGDALGIAPDFHARGRSGNPVPGPGEQEQGAVPRKAR